MCRRGFHGNSVSLELVGRIIEECSFFAPTVFHGGALSCQVLYRIQDLSSWGINQKSPVSKEKLGGLDFGGYPEENEIASSFVRVRAVLNSFYSTAL